MKSAGNGSPDVCANNLLKMVRGEVPFERVKGLDPRLVDRPLMAADAEIQQDAEWLIDTYEPRVSVRQITIAQVDAPGGGFAVTADVREKEA